MPQTLRTWSADLTGHILRTPEYAAASTVAAFVGVRGEPLTDDLLRATLEAGKHLVLPRVTDDKKNIAFYRLRRQSDLVRGGFGLREPPTTEPYDLRSDPQALLLIPGLGFNTAGCRLGFGKGHYDRVLAPVADLRPPVRIGVCLHPAFNPAGIALPRELHDVRMHKIVTNEGLFACHWPD